MRCQEVFFHTNLAKVMTSCQEGIIKFTSSFFRIAGFEYYETREVGNGNW